MNERIKSLRKQSLNAVASISIERAELLTEFYKSGEPNKHSIPVTRAKAFHYLLSNRAFLPHTVLRKRKIL